MFVREVQRMSKLKIILKLVVVSLVMFLHIKFIEFFYIDSCLDRGGRFLTREMMCEGENGFINFGLSPIFYIITCIVFGVVMLGALKLFERFSKKPKILLPENPF